MLRRWRKPSIIFETTRTRMERNYVTISFRNAFIDNVNSMKFPGVSVEETLNWHIYIKELCKKNNGICYSMMVVRKYVSISTLETFYYASFLSKVKYGIIFWRCSSEIKAFLLSKNNNIRVIFNIPVIFFCRSQFKINCNLIIPGIYICECRIFIFKYKPIQQWETPTSLQNEELWKL